MKKILILAVCIIILSVLPGCEQELALSLLTSSSDISTPVNVFTDKDAATHLLFTDHNSELYGSVSPYLGISVSEEGTVYACYDGYFTADEALRVISSASSSDLALADPMYLRPAASAKLRTDPSRESESLCLVSSEEVYPISAVSVTDAVYYRISAEEGSGFICSDAAEVSSDRAALEFYAAMEVYSPVGAQLAIIDNGKIAGSYSWGLSDIESGTDMTPDTTIRSASLSKLPFCIAAMHLQDKGIIDIDSSIGTYWGLEALSNSRYPDEVVSLRTILAHNSSIKPRSEYPDREGMSELMKNKKFFDTSEKPGAKSAWVYNNFAVGAGGATLEMASGRTMQDYMNENIFSPMDITAGYSRSTLPEGCTDAVLYSAGGTSRSGAEALAASVSETPGDNSRFFAGGLHISAHDYAKLLIMLMNDGEYYGTRILSEEAVAEIETPCFEVSDSSCTFSQCLILRKCDLYGRTLFYHSGNAYGTIAFASYDPESGDGVVIIATGMDKSTAQNGMYNICNAVSEIMYTKIL